MDLRVDQVFAALVLAASVLSLMIWTQVEQIRIRGEAAESTLKKAGRSRADVSDLRSAIISPMFLPSEAEIRELSPEERIRLIGLLWASFVDDPSTLPVTDEQRVELRRRVAEHDADPAAARSWSEVLTELERE